MSYYEEADKYYYQKNYKKAYDLYQAGVDSGDVKCYFGIAVLHCNGYYLKESYRKTQKLLDKYIPKIEELAEGGDGEASYIMYEYLSEEFDENEDKEKGYEWLKRSAEQGYLRAQVKLAVHTLAGGCYERCNDCEEDCEDYEPPNATEALRLFKLAAAGGHTRSKYWIGYIYEKYDVVGIDLAQAKKWYAEAANEGDAEAKQRLSRLLEYEEIAEKESTDHFYRGMIKILDGKFDEAYKIFEEGFECEDLKSYFGVAYLAFEEKGCDKDMETANEMFEEIIPAIRTLADKGDSDAMYILCLCYVYGCGKCPKNSKIAIEWCRRAIDKKNIFAAFLMGEWCMEGLLSSTSKYYIEHNESKAEYYYSIAGENYSDMQYLVGKAYSKRRSEYRKKAWEWLEKAASNGHPSAAEEADSVMIQMLQRQSHYSWSDIEFLKKKHVEGDERVKELWLYANYGMGITLAKSDGLDDLLESTACCEYVMTHGERLYSKNTMDSLKNLYTDVCYSIANIYDFSMRDLGKAIEFYTKAETYGKVRAKFDLAMIYYCGEGFVNYSKAIYNFKKCTELGIEEGKSHYYLGNCFYWGLGVPVDFEIAKKHYISAYEYGFNCDYAIDTVVAELGERIGESSMQEYAESIKKLNLSDEKLAIRINKDLISDFGSTWEKLSDNSRRSLATAMETYVHIYCKGPHKYGNYDFSGVVGGMCRALEIELERCLYTGYIKYLKENDVSPNSFEGKRSFLKRISANDCAYDEKTSNFTLGAIYTTIGEGKKSGDILDSSMIDYLDFAFKNDAFNEGERRVAITNYILSLADSVYTIAEQHRNAAAHTEVIKCKRAEICGDYIIKVQKLLCKFVEKIKK